MQSPPCIMCHLRMNIWKSKRRVVHHTMSQTWRLTQVESKKAETALDLTSTSSADNPGYYNGTIPEISSRSGPLEEGLWTLRALNRRMKSLWGIPAESGRTKPSSGTHLLSIQERSSFMDHCLREEQQIKVSQNTCLTLTPQMLWPSTIGSIISQSSSLIAPSLKCKSTATVGDRSQSAETSRLTNL